ncbi:MAG: flotillin domain-containing protein [Candidatus Limnocylindrales bacterium]
MAEAKATQEVVQEQTKLAELAAERKAKELLASTVRPAEAEAEAVIRRAEGDRQAAIAAAQADAERVRLQGEAEAAIIFKTGEAEASALEMRAEAYRHFNDAAVLATILRDLPDTVRAAAEPIGQIDNLTVLSTDGASEIVRTTTSNLTQASAAIENLTGINMAQVFNNALDNANLTGSDKERAIRGREPDTVEDVEVDVTGDADAEEVDVTDAASAADEDKPQA